MKTHTMNLGQLSSLFHEKEKKLKDLIEDLDLSDVKEDSRFDKTVASIKRQILLSPIKVGDPKITNNKLVTRPVPENQQMIYGREIRMNGITVSYPFTGSAEILEHRTGESLTIDTIYLPSGDTIDLEIELKELDKVQALQKAREEMATTLKLISQNNPDVESWSQNMEKAIEEKIKQRRKALLDFYD